TFGAFVEILDGVEGLVHISELAPHHVESPREIVRPTDAIRVKILEIDSERRRLSLSAKRVEGQVLPISRPGATETAEEGGQDSTGGDGAAGDGETTGEGEQDARTSEPAPPVQAEVAADASADDSQAKASGTAAEASAAEATASEASP